MKSKETRSNLSLIQKFDELKLTQEKKPKFQIILDRIESMNNPSIEQNYEGNFSLDNSTESLLPED